MTRNQIKYEIGFVTNRTKLHSALIKARDVLIPEAGALTMSKGKYITQFRLIDTKFDFCNVWECHYKQSYICTFNNALLSCLFFFTFISMAK